MDSSLSIHKLIRIYPVKRSLCVVDILLYLFCIKTSTWAFMFITLFLGKFSSIDESALNSSAIISDRHIVGANDLREVSNFEDTSEVLPPGHAADLLEQDGYTYIEDEPAITGTRTKPVYSPLSRGNSYRECLTVKTFPVDVMDSFLDSTNLKGLPAIVSSMTGPHSSAPYSSNFISEDRFSLFIPPHSTSLLTFFPASLWPPKATGCP